jgi:hypothetical protein
VEHLHSRVPYFSHSETPHLLGRGIAAHATDTDRERFAGQCLGSWDLMRVYNLVDADGRIPIRTQNVPHTRRIPRAGLVQADDVSAGSRAKQSTAPAYCSVDRGAVCCHATGLPDYQPDLVLDVCGQPT